jgi:hypothetical protein
MSWDKNPPLEPVFALDTLRNRVNTILKSNQKRNNTQEGDYQLQAVSPLSVVPLKIVKNNCKPGETYRKTPFIHEITTL